MALALVARPLHPLLLPPHPLHSVASVSVAQRLLLPPLRLRLRLVGSADLASGVQRRHQARLLVLQ